MICNQFRFFGLDDPRYYADICANCGEIHEDHRDRPMMEKTMPHDDHLDIYAPGEWRCPQCNFCLSKMTLAVRTGEVGVSAQDIYHGEPCPNDGTPMVKVTWRERANDNYNAYVKLMEDVIAAAGAESLPGALKKIHALRASGEGLKHDQELYEDISRAIWALDMSHRDEWRATMRRLRDRLGLPSVTAPPVEPQKEEKDHGAGLIGQPIPDMEGTEPRLILRDVLAWAEGRCPCEDGLPNPCSLCGARAEHDHCMAADALFPGVLLANIRRVIGSGNPSSDAERAEATRRSEAQKENSHSSESSRSEGE